MLPTSTLFLYSTNAWLAFVINEEFYGGTHYVYASPIFDSAMVTRAKSLTPPSSTPKDIYLELLGDVSRGDRHSAKIGRLRRGITKGAEIMYAKAAISAKDLTEIKQIVSCSVINDFRPLLYVISYPGVIHMVRDVPIKERAHPLSQEYVIEGLSSVNFQALDLA
jgi:hypothetical protein